MRQLHARGLLLPAVVVAAALGVLLHGALDREPVAQASESIAPRPVQQSPPPIRADLEKTPLTYFSDYWRQMGERAEPKFISIGVSQRAGVVVAPGLALTSLDAAEEWQASQAALSADEAALRDFVGPPADLVPTTLPYRLAAVDTDLGAALFELSRPYPASNFSFADPGLSPPGSFVATVAMLPEGVSVTPAHLSSASHHGIEISALPPTTGGAAAVVDLDGGLLGLLVDRGEETRLISAELVLHLVERYLEGRPCLAIIAGELDPGVAEILGLDAGLVIESVRDAAFEPEPSLRPGDVLVEWNRQPVAPGADFESLYMASGVGSLVPFSVIRAGRRVRGSTKLPDADCQPTRQQPTVFAAAGMTMVWRNAQERSAWLVLAVEAGSLAEAVVSPADLILAVNSRTGRRNSQREMEKFEQTGATLLLTVESQGRVQLRAIQAPSE